MEPRDFACSEQTCVRFRACPQCGRRFATDDRDREFCERCDPPAADTWTPFRPK